MSNLVPNHLPEVGIGAVKNIYIRSMYFEKAGQEEDGHSHPIDHITLLTSGGLRLIVGGVATDFYARDGRPQMIYIKAGLEHTLKALVDHTAACCVHALRLDNETADIIDPEMIPRGVNALAAGIAAPLTEKTTPPRLPDYDIEVHYA